VNVTFLARGDTATRQGGTRCCRRNIAFKVLGPFGQGGLAVATFIAAWINFGLVLWVGVRAGLTRCELGRSLRRLGAPALIPAAPLWIGRRSVARPPTKYIRLYILAFGVDFGLHEKVATESDVYSFHRVAARDI